MRIARMSVVAVALLMAVGLCFAADAMKMNGTVKSVNIEKSTVTVVEGGKNFTFAVNADTKITAGDAARTIADIKADLKVEVEYTVAGEARTATAIKILATETK